MFLSALKVGESAKILNIFSDESMKRRLYDLGFFPGKTIQCVLKSPFLSPTLYSVNKAFIALRVSDAKEIEVQNEK